MRPRPGCTCTGPPCTTGWTRRRSCAASTCGTGTTGWPCTWGSSWPGWLTCTHLGPMLADDRAEAGIGRKAEARGAVGPDLPGPGRADLLDGRVKLPVDQRGG